MITGLRRYGRVYRAVLVQAVRRDLQFRAQAWTTAVVALAQVVIGLVPVLVVTANAGSTGVRGWSAPAMLAVAGCFQLALGLLDAFVVPNLIRVNDYVQRGELDGVLMRPLDAQWLSTFRWVQPAALAGALGGAVLLGVGLRSSPISPADLVSALLLFGCGCWLITLLWANASYLAFWFEAAAFVHDLVRAVLSAGRFPVAFFPAAVRIALLSVVPVGVAATLPVQALTRGVPLLTLATVAVMTVAATGLTRLHWRLALRRYASASS